MSVERLKQKTVLSFLSKKKKSGPTRKEDRKRLKKF
jgi:hypothetical protein